MRAQAPAAPAGSREDVARRSLEAFGVRRPARVEFVNRRENEVFRARAGADDWAVKVHRPEYHRDSEIESESSFLAALSEAGMPVPTPLAHPGGGHVVHIDDGDGTVYQVTAQRWVGDATPLGSSPSLFTGRSRPDPKLLVALGRTMAELHRCAESTGVPDGYDRRAWDAAGLCGPHALWGSAADLPGLTEHERTTLLAAERVLAEHLRRLARTADVFGPIHADLTVENILVRGDEFAFIDFDDSGEGWYLFDLATAAFFFTGHPDAEELVTALASGYLQSRPLRDEARSGWQPLLLARALSYLGWSVDRPDEEATRFHREAVLPHVLRGAARYLETGATGWPELP